MSTLGPPGNLRSLDDFSPEPSRTGIWVGLAAISMSFAAFTSALSSGVSSVAFMVHPSSGLVS